MHNDLQDSIVQLKNTQGKRFLYPSKTYGDTNKGKRLHSKVRINDVDIYVRSPKYSICKKALYAFIGFMIGFIVSKL